MPRDNRAHQPEFEVYGKSIRIGRRSFVNGRIKLSRESAITKSIVSKPGVTMLRGIT